MKNVEWKEFTKIPIKINADLLQFPNLFQLSYPGMANVGQRTIFCPLRLFEWPEQVFFFKTSVINLRLARVFTPIKCLFSAWSDFYALNLALLFKPLAIPYDLFLLLRCNNKVGYHRKHECQHQKYENYHPIFQQTPNLAVCEK